MIDLIQAILAIDPNAKVAVNNIDSITWYDGNPKNITKEQIQKKYNELVLDYEKNEKYKDLRLNEYPSLQDCIHALLDGGKTLENLQKIRAEIKKKYPKAK
jgi:uncharacterized membrane protein